MHFIITMHDKLNLDEMKMWRNMASLVNVVTLWNEGQNEGTKTMELKQ